MQENLESSRNELVYFSRQASKITRKKLVDSPMILRFDPVNSRCGLINFDRVSNSIATQHDFTSASAIDKYPGL